MNAVLNSAATNVSTPNVSISTSAMLVELSISTWTGRKLDKRASQDVTTSNNARKGVANVNKKLLGDCAELDAVQKFVANVRNSHYAATMPWSDTGLRLLPTAQYFAYHKQMTDLQAEFDRLVGVFLQAYEWEIQNAQLKLGDLFNADEYPSADSLKFKFKYRLNYIRLAEAGDWRLDMEQEAQQALREQYDKFYQAQFQDAMKDVWRRAYDALTKMSDKLDYTDVGSKKIFRDTLVSNVMDIVDLMEVCNITRDPAMTEAQGRIRYALQGITPEALREDAHLRADTKRQVDEVRQIIDNLPGMGF